MALLYFLDCKVSGNIIIPSSKFKAGIRLQKYIKSSTLVTLSRRMMKMRDETTENRLINYNSEDFT